jgi:hypothetical protein
MPDYSPAKNADIELRILEGRIKNLSNHLDQLYKKGKADGWPKEVMDYIMWFEHEVCRIPVYMPETARKIRAGFAKD